MRRWSINLLCAASLLIFLLAMGIWVRSYFVQYWIDQTVTLPQGSILAKHFVSCSGGAVRYSHAPLGPGYEEWDYGYRSPPLPFLFPAPTFMGFGFTRGPVDPFGVHGERSELQFPMLLFGLFAIPPVLWVRRWRRKRGRGFPVEVSEPTEATA